MKVTIVGGGPGGLYAALLIKKEWPGHEVGVFERNRADDTFGFGVVFSDETLGLFRDYDRPSYQSIRRAFSYWDDVDIHYQGEVFRVAGNGFAGCSRQALLALLQARCAELGVRLHFGCELDPRRLEGLGSDLDSDLIIAADGINSRIRERYRDHFGTTTTLGRNLFSWLGSTKELGAFKYFFRMTPRGVVVAHCYGYEPGRSTWVIEMSPATWQGLGFAGLGEEASARMVERIFEEELEGHPLLTNRSLWRSFPTVQNERWVKDNLVLLGDAKASAHYAIGSGTKLAMEDAAALLEALRTHPEDVRAALHHFEEARREEVGKTQHAAGVSAAWFESMGRYWGMAPERFAFGVMSRSKQITVENLRLRDASFTERVEGWFLDEVRGQGFRVAPRTPPMFTPFKLREMVLDNRVVVSPMAQYMAADGIPGDWHLMHLGSRAVGGAGLVFTEMTCVSAGARISPGCTGLWNGAQQDAWRRIVAFIHAHSPAKVCLQLGHAGRKGSTQLGWEESDRPLKEGNWPLYAASPLPYYPESQVPTEMSRAHMDEVVADFVRAARYGEAAGFDMLELHMAHGYLLAGFISPLTNRRSDGYGGGIAGRMRFPLEVFAAVRALWPSAKPMSVRLSATDWFPGGLTDEDLLAAARLLKEAGCDLIDLSTGQTVPEQTPVYGRMYQTPFADKVRRETGIATMTVGNITSADQVNTVLLQGRADLVALARPHLSNPHFTLHAAAEYDYRAQPWPKPYLSAQPQAHRLAQQAREEWREGRLALRPPTHRVDAEKTEEEPDDLRHPKEV